MDERWVIRNGCVPFTRVTAYRRYMGSGGRHDGARTFSNGGAPMAGVVGCGANVFQRRSADGRSRRLWDQTLSISGLVAAAWSWQGALVVARTFSTGRRGPVDERWVIRNGCLPLTRVTTYRRYMGSGGRHDGARTFSTKRRGPVWSGSTGHDPRANGLARSFPETRIELPATHTSPAPRPLRRRRCGPASS